MSYPVTLIITHFQQLIYLKKLLSYGKSNRWFGANEVIVVDDRSMSIEEIESIKNEYPSINVYSNSSNKGPSFSRNFGASRATGEYIQFLDADDWITPDKIELQYLKAVELGYPTFICSEWSRVTFDSSFKNYEIIHNYSPNFDEPALINIMANFFPLMSGLIRREGFLAVGGFLEDMRLIEDVNLAIRLYNHDRKFIFFSLNTPCFFYRVNNPNSLSNSNRLEFNKAILRNYKLSFEFAESLYPVEKMELHRTASFNVLWHIYLSACALKEPNLLLDVIQEMQKSKRPLALTNKHGKTFLLVKILGEKLAAKILMLKST